MAQVYEEVSKCLNDGTWREEAEGVISDVKDQVKHIELSNINNLKNSICINLTTAESENYCIELGSFGFRIVGLQYDDNSCPSDKFYETPYSLLSEISPKYRQLFGISLIEKLQELTKN